MRIKDEIFCFAYLRWCHNGWVSNILIVVDTGYAGIHHSKYWMSIDYDTIEDRQNKTFIFYSLSDCLICFQQESLFFNNYILPCGIFCLSLNFHFTDSQQPNLTCPQNVTQRTDDMQPNANVYWNILATDNSGQDPDVSCSPSSGSTFDLGITFVVCDASDLSQNAVSCSFHVNIVGELSLPISYLNIIK